MTLKAYATKHHNSASQVIVNTHTRAQTNNYLVSKSTYPVQIEQCKIINSNKTNQRAPDTWPHPQSVQQMK